MSNQENKLSGEERRKLREAIISAYPKIGDLKIMVSEELEENLNQITEERNLNDVVYYLIEWAESTGKLQQLIEGACKFDDRGNNPELKKICSNPKSGETNTHPQHPIFSKARLPVPASSLLFGRDELINKLDEIWKSGSIKNDEGENIPVRIVQIYADGGLGKTASVWHWINRIQESGDTRQQHLLEWSFFSQGKNDYIFDSQAFLDEAIRHFTKLCDRFPSEQQLEILSLSSNGKQKNADRIGEAIGEAIASFSGIVVLDGIEALQHPPDKLDGALYDNGLISLLNYLKNQPMLVNSEDSPQWMVVLTTRYPIPMLAGAGVYSISLDRLSDVDGARLLREFHLKNDTKQLEYEPGGDENREDLIESEFQNTAREYGGHPLALILLASYLLYQHDGDLAERTNINELEESFDDNPYQHADRIMRSYDRIFAENGTPLSKACRQVLSILGLFTRPVSQELIDKLLEAPQIPNLTDALNPALFKKVVIKLQGLRILLNLKENQSDYALDAHPLVREYFGQKVLKQKYPDAWREGQLRLYRFFCTHAPELPENREQMESLFQAVIHGCKAGQHEEVLHEVYLKRIMREQKYYAFASLKALNPLISCLSHFFEPGQWNQPVSKLPDGSGLIVEDQITVLSHATLFLMANNGYADPDVKKICAKAVDLCENVSTPQQFSALCQFWIYYLVRAELKQAWEFAQRLLKLTESSEGQSRRIEAHYAAGFSLLFIERVEDAKQHLKEVIRLYNPQEHASLAFLHIHDICAASMCFLALALIYQEELDEALTIMSKANKLAHQLNQPYTIVCSEVYFARVYLARKEYSKAKVLLESARKSCVDYGFWFWEALASIFYSNCLSYEDNHKQAMNEASRGVSLFKKAGGLLSFPGFLCMAVDVHMRGGDLDKSHQLLDEAFAYAQKTDQYRDYADLLRLKGEILFQEGASRENVQECFSEALKYARLKGTPNIEKLVLDSIKQHGFEAK